MNVLANEMGNISIDKPDVLSPSTPNSYGFSGCPDRLATVNIQYQNMEKSFQQVYIYLVNDMQDMNKAGLLFKSDGVEIDLQI